MTQENENKKTEFLNMLSKFDNKHNEFLRRFAYFLGRNQRKFNNPIGRFILSRITTKIMANLIIKHRLFDVEKKDNMSLEEIALNWLKPSIFFRIPTEIDEVTDERIVVLRPECTIGLKEPECSKLCRASMNMDFEIIRQLGGKLTVTETILEGAPKCRHIIEKI